MNLLYSGFLYFPEDKSAYIPAVIEFGIMIILCIGVFMLLKRISKKQEMKTKELEARILAERQKEKEEEQAELHT